jgi:hypothetical protein
MMYAKRFSHASTRPVVVSGLAILGLVLCLPAQLQAQQVVEKKKDQPKPAATPQDEGLNKIKAKLETVNPGNDEVRKLQIERWKVALRRYDQLPALLEIDPNPAPAVRDQIHPAVRNLIHECYGNALMAALELIDSPTEQNSLLEELINDAKLQEDDARDSIRIGFALPQDLEEARNRRMSFELLLLKAKRKADPNYGSAELRKLYQELLACAKAEYNLAKARKHVIDVTGDGSAWVQQLITCNRRQLDYGLELSQSSEEKLALINVSLKEARELEADLIDRAKKGWRGQRYDPINAQVHRLDLEILLAQINHASNPNTPERSQNELAKLLMSRLLAAKQAEELIKEGAPFTDDRVPDAPLIGLTSGIQRLFDIRRNLLVFALQSDQREANGDAIIKSIMVKTKDIESNLEREAKNGPRLTSLALDFVRDQRLQFEILIAKSKQAAKAKK